MSPRQRKEYLDERERRLNEPKRIALFGHRAVGKTTLLAMFYREASAGRVPGLRLAARRPATAEYLGERIAQIESGEPLPGTLAETELHLRLYHGLARLDLTVKDYQGEHVALGSDAPIREFFADCDAVLLCLDPEGTDPPVERRRRQQEVEELLERYIESTPNGTAGRPVALLITKYDHVIEQGGPPPGEVERLADARFGMTRHALAVHAPRSALFAVSAYGCGAVGDRPPAELHPMGLEGPLLWLAEQLEEADREAIEWIWDVAPTDVRRLSRCVRAFERRYPRSDQIIDFRRRLAKLRRAEIARNLLRAGAGMALVALAAAGYDALGYRSAVAYERDHSPGAVERHWREFRAWHPSQAWFFPRQAEAARRRHDVAIVRAEGQRIASGAASSQPPAALERLKEEAPELLSDIRRLEQARDRQRHDASWKTLQTDDLAGGESPEARIISYRSFLRDHPETPHRAEALSALGRWEERLLDLRTRSEQAELDTLHREATAAGVDRGSLAEKLRAFLERHPRSAVREEAETLLDETSARIDEADIQKARDFSRSFPTNFPARLRKYEDYLAAHQEGGKFVREALQAVESIERDRERYAYRQAYDHALSHPNDVAEIAGRLRSYLDTHPAGRHVAAARDYLAWWDKITRPGEYRVVLQRGEVEPGVGKYLGGGGPNLEVEIWVNGVKYGPSPVAPNTYQPIWNYTFARPIVWKYGDPVVVRIVDTDWSDSGVFRIISPKEDPLAMRYLSGELKPARGGRTKLVFASDFRVPTLPRPE